VNSFNLFHRKDVSLGVSSPLKVKKQTQTSPLLQLPATATAAVMSFCSLFVAIIGTQIFQFTNGFFRFGFGGNFHGFLL